MARGARRWSGVASTASIMVGYGGMAWQSLGDGCVMMDTCRVMALFGDVDGRLNKGYVWFIILKIG